MRLLMSLFGTLVIFQTAHADVAIRVDGTKEEVLAYGGVSYHRIVTREGQVILLDKSSAEKFPDCRSGSYTVVSSSALPAASARRVVMTLLAMECQDN